MIWQTRRERDGCLNINAIAAGKITCMSRASASQDTQDPRSHASLETVPAVVVGGSLNGLGVVRSLSQGGMPIYLVATTRLCAAGWSRHCTFVPVEGPDEISLMDALVALGRRLADRPVLILTSEQSVNTVSTHRKELESLYRFSLPSEEVVQTLADKTLFHELAEREGFPVPRSVPVADAPDLGRLTELTPPLIIKPADKTLALSRLVERAVLAATLADAQRTCERMLTQARRLVVQEWIAGPDSEIFFTLFSCDGHGRLIGLFPGRKLVCDPPTIGTTALCVAAPEMAAELTPVTLGFINRLGYRGFGSLEFKRESRSGRCLIIEPTVGRTDWQEEIATLCTLNLPLLTYHAELGRRGPPLSGPVTPVAWRASAEFRAPLARGLRVIDGFFRWSDPLPALYHYFYERGLARVWRRVAGTKAAALLSSRQRIGMSTDIDTAIVGAGPYGLSIAAHLRSARRSFEIFGTPMDSWRRSMPEGMLLKSERFASNLWDPDRRYTLQDYCKLRGLPWQPVGSPLSLALFLEYADWFRQHAVGEARDVHVTRLQRVNGRFRLQLADGTCVKSRRVVLATGHMAFRVVPPELSHLPEPLMLHSTSIGDVKAHADREVCVVGAGQSALETAALLHESGARVRVLVRRDRIEWNPPSKLRPLLARIFKPDAGVATGWQSVAVSELPRMFRWKFSPEKRHRFVAGSYGPSGSWWLRERIMNRVAVTLSARVTSATAEGGRVRLKVAGLSDASELTVDRVVAATGFRVDIDRIGYLDRPLAEEIAREGSGIPALDNAFQTSVPGLFIVGLASAPVFGPIMRFMYGAKHVAPVLARRLTTE